MAHVADAAYSIDWTSSVFHSCFIRGPALGLAV